MPATTNFLPINIPKNNQENDAAYLVDSIRLNGAPTAALLPSPFWNKAAYQSAMFPAAFCQMMANKGTSTSDADFDTLVAALATVRLESDFEASIIAVPYSGTMTFDCAQSSGFHTTLTGNVGSSNLINFNPGQIITFFITQDGTGNRVFSWPSQVSTFQVCPLPGSTTMQSFFVLDTGVFMPYSTLKWITAGGLVIQPAGSVVPISANGTVSNVFSDLTESINASGGAITRNLFTAVGFQGFTVNFKKDPADSTNNSITLNPLAGQTIDGFSSFTFFKPYNCYSLKASGSNWLIY